MDIICAIGPAVLSCQWIDKLVAQGMTTLRFNFSHADYGKFRELVLHVRSHHPSVKILQDLQGPKLRVGPSFSKEVKVRPTDPVVFCLEKHYSFCVKEYKRYLVIPIDFEGDFSLFSKVQTISMKDATIEFDSLCPKDLVIFAKVKRGGIIRAEKGINAPLMDRSTLGMTQKDRRDLEFGIASQVDVICYSFAASKTHVQEVKDYMHEVAGEKNLRVPKLWAKIECREGVEAFSEILSLVDGIMLGRGDLRAEVDPLEIPRIQDGILTRMQEQEKPLVIATYLLESLRKGQIVTLAELNDIYQCLKKGAQGFMLSGEVAVGQNPLLPLETLAKLIRNFRAEEGGASYSHVLSKDRKDGS